MVGTSLSWGTYLNLLDCRLSKSADFGKVFADNENLGG